LTNPPLEDLTARLERERQEADRRYNDALTLLDRAIQTVVDPGTPPQAPDRSRVPDLNRSWDILPDGAPPPDRSFKGRLRAFVWRIVGPPLELQRRFNALVVEQVNQGVGAERDVVAAIGRLADTMAADQASLVRFESLLVQYLQTVTAYVDSKDRALLGTNLGERMRMAEQRILAIKRALEAGGEGSPPAAAGGGSDGRAALSSVDQSAYVGFEDRFRGPEPEIRARVEEYIPILEAAQDVVDIGCGRGELLQALKDRGIRARGVDANAAMVELCRSRGLDVVHLDALRFLEQQTEQSMGGLVAVQVVEHFEPAYLVKFLEAAFHTLRPGAPLVLETINAACWMAFFETYTRDLTHQRPLHPDTLRFLVEASGFTAVEIQFRQPVSDADRLPRVKLSGEAGGTLPRHVAQLADAVNAHADRLNARLFSSMDYAVIARR